MLKLIDINKSFDLGKTGKINILKNINIEIKEGEFVSIVGTSGSGKSTLLNIIGLLDTPTSGEYYLKNQRIDNLRDSKKTKIRASSIGFIFQNYSLLPRINALGQVLLPLQYAGMGGSEARDLAKKYLEQVGLGDKLKNKPNELSGGQSQRVAIARALVINPDIILADEPTGALDSKTGEEIIDLFKKINSTGKTIIMVTHDIELARRADRIIEIKDGFIIN